jgi:hypothetical protein
MSYDDDEEMMNSDEMIYIKIKGEDEEIKRIFDATLLLNKQTQDQAFIVPYEHTSSIKNKNLGCGRSPR